MHDLQWCNAPRKTYIKDICHKMPASSASMPKFVKDRMSWQLAKVNVNKVPNSVGELYALVMFINMTLKVCETTAVLHALWCIVAVIVHAWWQQHCGRAM